MTTAARMLTEDMVRTRVVRHRGGVAVWSPTRSSDYRWGMYRAWRSFSAYKAGAKHVAFKAGRGFDAEVAKGLIDEVCGEEA